LGAILGYLVYPILTRILTPSVFSEFAIQITLISQASALFATLNVLALHIVKSYPSSKHQQGVEAVQKFFLWFFAALCVLFLLSSPVIQKVLNINDGSLLFLSVGILIISVPIILWTGYLQGNKEIVRVGIYSFTAGFFKLIMSVLGGIYFGVFGALLGILIGTILGAVALTIYPGIDLPSLKSIFNKFNKSEVFFIKNILKYSIIILIVVGILSIMQNIGIIFAKMKFSAEDAGYFSAVSIVSNSLFYIISLLTWIILPHIDVGQNNKNKKLIIKSFLLTLLFSFFILLIEFLYANFIILLILGERFQNDSIILVSSSMYQIMIAFLCLYSFYALIIKKREVILLSIFIFLSLIITYTFSATSPVNLSLGLLINISIAVVLYIIIKIINYLIAHRKPV
jgi:O-antigen/teichoic acid export membrane protein